MTIPKLKAMNTITPWVAVVDDEEPVCRSLLRLLRSAGIKARGFYSGVEFLDSLALSKPICVILDVNMPLIYGEGNEKAFRRLREEIEKASKGRFLYFRNRH